MFETICCSGDIPDRGLDDLRLLLRIRGHDAIDSIARMLPEREMVSLLDVWNRIKIQVKTADDLRERWRPHIGLITSTSLIRELHQRLIDAYHQTEDRHQVDQEYRDLQRIHGLFWSAEWEGMTVDTRAEGISPSFSSLLEKYVVDGLMYPRVDVVPRETTGRMGIRGGYTVMSWPHGMRHALVARPGRKIVSVDFVAMDVRSLMVLNDDFRAMITGDDPYMSIAENGLTAIEKDVARKIVKASFVPMVYGASDSAIAASLGCTVHSASQLRSRLHPFIRQFSCGPDLARLSQGVSSMAFRGALSMLPGSDRIRGLFPVHDELVLEVDEQNIDVTISDMIVPTLLYGAEMATENKVSYQVRVKVGQNYGDLIESNT